MLKGEHTMLYIGIDLGTSAVKLLLMEQSGRVLRTVQRRYPLSFPRNGWSEQSPEDWWSQTCAGTRALLEGFDPAAVDGTMLEQTELEIEVLPGNGLCKSCGKVFNLREHERTCPRCGARSWELLGGKEFNIKEILAC